MSRGGVYEIRCIHTENRYIGQSRVVKARIATHFSQLYRGKHECSHMQSDFDAYGEDGFVCGIILVSDDLATLRRSEAEAQAIANKKGKLYNYVANPNKAQAEASLRAKKEWLERRCVISSEWKPQWKEHIEAIKNYSPVKDGDHDR